MLRILSVLIVIVGLVVAGFGGAALLERYAPQEELAAASAPVEEISAASAPAEEPAFEVAAAEAPINEVAPPPEASAKSVPEAGEPAISEEESQFNFQTEMEPSPMARSAAPEASESFEAMPEISAMSAPASAGPSFEDTLRTVPVAHETPRSAEYKRAFDVTFAIDATGDTTAADALPGRGVIEESEAKVSERVEVRVSGAAFNIVAASPPVQTLSPMTENTWRWSVTPLTAGDHDLVFEVFAIDSDAVTPLRTFQDTVTVKVSGLNRAIAFADQANPLFVLLGGLGSALAGLFAAFRFFGNK
ncbi:hypothetical protein [Hyphomonas sp.]|uniref:hypothetical protein n=1 Tax=Hyphomonas sp. TaxID=87 RepID=UPI000ABFB59D|nr:hypothetical protein [Hyphomonas sp.]MBA4340104.1 hypothetical protein [Hyphomonas sp.]